MRDAMTQPAGKVIAGNWKMHHGPAATLDFFRTFQLQESPGHTSVILFPPAVSFAAARQGIGKSRGVSLGVQNIHWEPKGAFTGELSAEMAAEAGASFALVGHSERRHGFGETDAETRLKVEAALRAGLAPILCVGETLEERTGGQMEAVVIRQLDAVLSVAGGTLQRSGREGAGPALLIAYEPVWAIGTGRTATPEDAAEAHALIRARLAVALGNSVARSTKVLYGGSVKPENAAELLASQDVDGLLVGGASLDPVSFAQIVAAAG